MVKSIIIELMFPLEVGDKKAIESFTLTRPKTREILKLVQLYGQEIVTLIFSGDGEGIREKLHILQGDDAALGVHIATLLSDDKMNGLVDVFQGLTGLGREAILEIDPADYPSIAKGLAGFFPKLMALMNEARSEKSSADLSMDPATLPAPSDGHPTR